MNDEQYFLANAYLDGELTVDERRIAGDDPEVMAEVEQLRALQSELRATPKPGIEAREAAISAAMAAFGGSAAVGSVGDSPTSETGAAQVVLFRPRPAYAKALAIAAAVVAVAGLGIVVSQFGQSDENTDIAADMIQEASLDDQGARTEAIAEAPADESMIADDASDAGDGAVSETDSAGVDAATEPMADDQLDTPTDDTAAAAGDLPEADAIEYREIPVDFDPAAPISDETELGVYGVHLITERDNGRLPPTPNHACVEAMHVLDEASLVLDGDLVSVYVDVREADGLAVALRTDTCIEVSVGSLIAD